MDEPHGESLELLPLVTVAEKDPSALVLSIRITVVKNSTEERSSLIGNKLGMYFIVNQSIIKLDLRVCMSFLKPEIRPSQRSRSRARSLQEQ